MKLRVSQSEGDFINKEPWSQKAVIFSGLSGFIPLIALFKTNIYKTLVLVFFFLFIWALCCYWNANHVFLRLRNYADILESDKKRLTADLTKEEKLVETTRQIADKYEARTFVLSDKIQNMLEKNASKYADSVLEASKNAEMKQEQSAISASVNASESPADSKQSNNQTQSQIQVPSPVPNLNQTP